MYQEFEEMVAVMLVIELEEFGLVTPSRQSDQRPAAGAATSWVPNQLPLPLLSYMS